ncbi:MAG: hypothetical protein K1X57_01810 [Gemmataceae bacterium]|nr:hypothetical protein [Gemmataceae bacterium]
MPFALHTTWHTYGDWLPGDERGHVSNIVIPGGGFVRKRNTPGTPVMEGDPHTKQRARDIMLGEPVLLTPGLALDAMHSVLAAANTRGWQILRAAAMRNHIHIVTTECPNDGPAVRRVFKGVSQSDLSKGHGARRWWAAGGSDRYKNDWAAIEEAVNYVARQEFKLAEIVDGEARLCE